MPGTAILEQTHLAFIEFLLLYKRRVIELGEEYDLPPMQALTLFLLSEPRPMNSFCKTFNCDPSNITGIVDGLEQKGLVERAESETDRRVKMVQLTPAGTAIRSALLTEVTGPDSLIISKLNPKEISQLIHLLEKITKH